MDAYAAAAASLADLTVESEKIPPPPLPTTRDIVFYTVFYVSIREYRAVMKGFPRGFVKNALCSVAIYMFLCASLESRGGEGGGLTSILMGGGECNNLRRQYSIPSVCRSPR